MTHKSGGKSIQEGLRMLVRYDFKCKECNFIFETMIDRKDIIGKILPCKIEGCTGKCGQYYGNIKPEIGMKVERVKDLMKKKAWRKEHIKPDEWFKKQTTDLQDKNEKKLKEKILKEGKLDEINWNRKNLGFKEL